MASFDVTQLTASNDYVQRALSRVREWWWLVLLGLTLQMWWALRLDHPTYFDAYYYTTNAQRLAEGKGFTEEIIWHYLDDPQGLPTPSHTYWMPLTSIIGAIGYRLLGTFRGAQLPFWLMAGLLPLLSYTICYQLARDRFLANAAAAFTAAGGYYAAYWVQPSTFVLFAWTGGGCLLALARAHTRKQPLYWFLAGVTAGLSHLTRADGVLLILLGLLVWIYMPEGWYHALKKKESALLRTAFTGLVLLLLGYFLIMAPWFWRTWQLTGSPLSTVGTQTMFLTQYNDVFAYGREFTLQHYLAWGFDNIIHSKLKAASLAVQTFIGVVGLTAFTFFAVIAWWWAWRQRDKGNYVRPFTWFALLLFITMSLVFTFPGQRGSLLHSSTALWPWSMALVPIGVNIMVEWIASKRTHWRPQHAKRLFLPVFVLMAFVITLAVASNQPLHSEEASVYTQLSKLLPADAVVMTGDPSGLYYHANRRAIVTPNEPPDVMIDVARRYGATYLLLDANRPPPLNDLYEGRYETDRLKLIRDFGAGFRLYAFVKEGAQ